MKKEWFVLAIWFFCTLVPKFALADENYEFRGKHFIASYLECEEQALSDVDTLKQIMIRAASECGATVLESIDHVFPPDGLTMVILLSESHASIHTYPEHRACFVDLFTCGDHCSNEKFHRVLLEYLKPGVVSHKTLVRDQQVEEID